LGRDQSAKGGRKAAKITQKEEEKKGQKKIHWGERKRKVGGKKKGKEGMEKGRDFDIGGRAKGGHLQITRTQGYSGRDETVFKRKRIQKEIGEYVGREAKSFPEDSQFDDDGASRGGDGVATSRG